MSIIELKNIHKSFGKKKILNGINITVEKGETMVLLGPSGTGKSVTLKHITGLMEPDAGECKVFGTNISGADEKVKSGIRTKMGVLFQSAALINWLTVFDNVALPLREHRVADEKTIQKIVTEKLEWLDVMHAADAYPANISGGMQKRVGLARAIVGNPEIILYDEPTSGLDPVMSNVINELIIKLQKELNISSIVVTHDMNSAYMIASRISFIFKGRILFCGNADEIQKSENEVVQQFIHGYTKGPITQ